MEFKLHAPFQATGDQPEASAAKKSLKPFVMQARNPFTFQEINFKAKSLPISN